MVGVPSGVCFFCPSRVCLQSWTSTPSPFSTPKRKREQMLADHIPDFHPSSQQFTFSPGSSRTDDGSTSPRSCVAHRFRGLALGSSGGGVSSSGDGTGSARNSSRSPPSFGSSSSAMDTSSSSEMDVDNTEGGSRKRARLRDVVMLDAGGPAAAVIRDTPQNDQQLQQLQTQSSSLDRQRLSPKSLRFAIDTAVVEQSETMANTHTVTNHTTTAPSLPITLPSRAKPTTKKSRSRKATPQPQSQKQLPLPSATLTNLPILASEPPTGTTTAVTTTAPKTTTVITDPLRASLTWHDDEITIYDPDDSDDDGTGINGIGFKPTAAVAYARTVKRKQQLAEYRKREEREARARRNQRRRRGESPAVSGSGSGTDVKKKAERRRVRFMEGSGEVKVVV
ncbi:hypothetical protein B0T21DRAFT_388268 [Apiosordaria backusii]|uniref:Uncharacterized protein n=1 Tax=Apiosordaria backusii TaxID=314023 RepID=A0AA39ZPT6_9PEZI|nr:hypothetical protein B0T21DRAFT_388268 [Apiosordaria backusii]